ncbi:MAG: hypothetical protein HFF13_01170 [Angelakisella sp.]|jgi:hypothetical protein|nr:hypothetical protein [Angelakisella sp.]
MSSKGSFSQMAETLRSFGIEGLTPQLVAETEAGYSQMMAECQSVPDSWVVKMLIAEFMGEDTSTISMEEERVAEIASALLFSVGCGTTDRVTWAWSPSNSTVYTFDREVADLSSMYTDFLRGVAALGQGELAFQNIVEDLGGVDREKGCGRRKVCFQWDGRICLLEAEENNDWFDVSFISKLNQLILQGGGEKRLFCANCSQGCAVFYRSPQWAAAFQEATGLSLSEDGN